MGTWFDDEGLHWEPLWFFPWVETSTDTRRFGTSLYKTDRRWFRWTPKVIEECQDLQMNTMQTIQLRDGREQVRCAPWRDR